MAIKPGKYDPLKPDIELLDYKSKKRYGLRLEGASALQVGTISQDDTVHIRAAGKRVGDFDEQRSWKGGRGVWDLSKNPEGFGTLRTYGRCPKVTHTKRFYGNEPLGYEHPCSFCLIATTPCLGIPCLETLCTCRSRSLRAVRSTPITQDYGFENAARPEL